MNVCTYVGRDCRCAERINDCKSESARERQDVPLRLQHWEHLGVHRYYTPCVCCSKCVISITTCGAMFGEPLSRLCGVRSLASALTHPGLCSINTFTSPGCGWAFINSLEGSGTTRSKVSLFLSAFACPLFSSICHDLDFSFFFLRALAVEQYTQGYMSSNDNVMNFTCEKTNLYWTWRSNYTE